MSLLRLHASLFPIGETDPYWANVVSLHNFPGPDGSTTFIDATGKAWTAMGGAEIDRSLGYNAGQFNGTNNGYITSPTDSDWAMGTGDFTIEAWISASSVSGDRNIFGINVAGGVGFGLAGGNVFCGPTGVSYGVIGSTVLSTSVLVHVAASKDSGTMRIFINGVVDGSGGDSYNYFQSSATVGSNQVPPSSPAGFYSGWIQALRVTKGVARYTAGFTPPSAPFPTS